MVADDVPGPILMHPHDESGLQQDCRSIWYPLPSGTDRAQLADAVKQMISAKGPFLLETAVLEEENVMPMIKPGNSVDEMIFSID